ncbi:hypothetical protein ACFFX1_42160 [Dactylosporangium sucinum]|uniref:SnoaL-like domain-containing protein n=1 Tax=Dactylosporangium sucinum TaxID=1424081 RepID=A0A917X6W6_9ACTN|nr:hypothetical protein [Dactylosporangium sucinum]GGM78356.1 hypothetical protein GCM10007977_094870 [Dactylosporangium sucinum]
MTDIDPQELAERYVAQWIEPDPAKRRDAIERLWADDATHVLQPPVEIREAADRLGFAHQTLRAEGHDAIERRITGSYDHFIVGQGFTFRARGGAVRLDGVVRIGWDALVGGEVHGGGEDLLVLAPDGRIRTDYMFPE